jgi:hypothetical protein
MKTAILVFLLFMGTNTPAPDIEFVRSNYARAVKDKQLCRSLINQLTNDGQNSVHLAYLGAFQTIWANHTINPITKLSSFNKGKNNIEKAVKSNPADVEIRILRLSVQKNCPGFLGYDDNINEDTAILVEKINSISSPALREIAAQLLMNRSK